MQKATNPDAALRFKNTFNRPVLHGVNNERPMEKKIQIPQRSAMKNNQTARQADRSTCVCRDLKRFVYIESPVKFSWLKLINMMFVCSQLCWVVLRYALSNLRRQYLYPFFPMTGFCHFSTDHLEKNMMRPKSKEVSGEKGSCMTP